MTNDSLARFARGLYTEVLQEKEKLARKLEAEKTEALKNKDIELAKRFKQDIKLFKVNLSYEVKISLSKRENELSNALRQNREKAAEQVFASAKEKLEAYTNSEEYKEYLKKEFGTVAADFASGETVCAARAKDIELVKEICPVSQVKFEEAADSIIGGFTLKNDEIKIFADCTLESKLVEQKNQFYKISGLLFD